MAAIDADSVITINTVTGADSYLVRIYWNGDLIARYAGMQSGSKLAFAPMTTAEYAVTVTAQAESKDDSDESAPYAWSLNALPYVAAPSQVCDIQYVSDTYTGGPTNTDDSRIYLSATTRTDGAIVFSLATGVATNVPAFRKDDALGLTSFTVNGAPLTPFFTTTSRDGDAEYILMPVENHVLPVGTVIDYNGTLQWKTTLYPNAYRRNTVFSYAYGSECQSIYTDLAPVTDNLSPVTQKILRNGQLIILKNGKYYNALGTEIK